MDNGIQRSLEALVDTGRVWVSVGTVSAIESHPTLGLLADVTFLSRDGECQARIVYAGALLSPVSVDDEVLVLIPEGDENAAVAIAGLFSKPSPAPSCFDNTTPQVVHPNGVELRTSESAIVAPVVTEALLADLSASIAELASRVSAAGFPVDPAPTGPTTSLIANLATAYRTAAIKSE